MEFLKQNISKFKGINSEYEEAWHEVWKTRNVDASVYLSMYERYGEKRKAWSRIEKEIFAETIKICDEIIKLVS